MLRLAPQHLFVVNQLSIIHTLSINRPISPILTLRHTTVKLAQLRVLVAKDELLPGIKHLGLWIRSSYISVHWITGLDINFLRHLSFGRVAYI